jgi:hypothetical protein
MPVEDRGIDIKELSMIPFTEEDMLDVFVSGPHAHISADAEATFECETIVNPNLMRRLLGVEPDPWICAAFDQSFTFTCKTPRSVQVRKHRKKRINKKWAKKYGYKYIFEPLTMESVSIVPRDEEIDILGRPIQFPLADQDFVGGGGEVR